MSEGLVAAAMVVVGLQLALQAPVNGALATRTGALGASLVSFLVGLAIFGVVLALTGHLAGYGDLDSVEPYELIGGLCGAAYVAAATFSVGRIGAGAIAAATVAGQLSSGVFVDHVGWFGLESDPAGPLRVLAIPILVFGALMVSGNRERGGRLGLGALQPVPLLIVFLAGVAVGVQHPLNASLADGVGDLGAAGLNFAVGSLALLLAVLVAGDSKRLRRARGAPAWSFTGGLIGAITVLGSLAAVQVIGASALAATTIAGALAGSVLIDRFGIAGVPVRHLDSLRLLGLALLVVGTAVVL